MRRWIMLAAMGAATAGAAPPAGAAVESTQVPVVRLHASIEVRTPASAVWAQITSGANLVTWCPMWKSPANAKVNLTHVGAVLEFTDEWGNGGRSVVTYLAPGREIRVAHEPTRGDYMCQAKLILEPSPRGTLVHYWDQYTDESPPADLAATRKKTEAATESMLAALKKAAEKE